MIAKPTARQVPLLVGVVLACLAAGVFLLWRVALRKTADGAPVVYLLSVDDTSRARAGWRTKRLDPTLALRAGETANVPAGARVRVAYAADGRAELVNGPAKISAPANAAPTEPDFLRSPLGDVLTLTPPPPSVTAGTIRVRSPAGVTRFTKPVIDWVAIENMRYDVAILDPSDPMAPPRVAQNIRPPLPASSLETTMRRELNRDRIYELLVREAGSETVFGAARFLTSPGADDAALPQAPSDLLAEALAAMAKKPTRTGDAWLALAKLPKDWRETELAIRLRLAVAAELGLTDEFAEAKAAAERLRVK